MSEGGSGGEWGYFFAARHRFRNTASAMRAVPATAETTPTTTGVVSEADPSEEVVVTGFATEEAPGDGAGVTTDEGATISGERGVADEVAAAEGEGVAGEVAAVEGGGVAGVTVRATVGEGVVGGPKSSKTAKKSSSPMLASPPHDPSVNPARIAFPSEPAATAHIQSAPAPPSCGATEKNRKVNNIRC